MRVIAHNDGRELRGNERQLLHLARGLRDRGHDVLVSCRGDGALAQELERGGVPSTRVRPRGDLALASALEFRRLLAARRPDAVLLTSWKRVFLGSWLARSARVPRVVVRLGIVRPMPARSTKAWKLRRAFERQVDALVVNSQAVRRAWLESAPWFADERLSVIRNGVATVAGDAARLRRELGVAPSVRLVAVAAALEPRKGIDLLLRALGSLPDDVHALVAGSGPERAALGALAASLGVEDRVHWLGARADVPDVLAASAAFVLPSRLDSIPNALLEAMAAGVPVVTTRGNGAEEALGEADGRGAAGWIAAPEDPLALATAVTEALGASTARVQEARWRARHWFGVQRMVEEYERVLSTPAGTPR
jgi:glycosyltransferase involved in cell wall biosynthesis